MNRKQEQIYNKLKKETAKKHKEKKYAKLCIENDTCPHCGSLLRFVSGVLEDECCAGNTAFMGVYTCSSSKCNFLFGNGDLDELISGDTEYTEFINGKKLLSKVEKRRIRVAEKIDETYWAAPIEY